MTSNNYSQSQRVVFAIADMIYTHLENHLPGFCVFIHYVFRILLLFFTLLTLSRSHLKKKEGVGTGALGTILVSSFHGLFYFLFIYFRFQSFAFICRRVKGVKSELLGDQMSATHL